MSTIFQIKTSSDNQYYFILVNHKNNVLLKSEMYTQKQSCHNGIESVKENAIHNKSYERNVGQDGKHYFNLRASNGQVIATSLMYEDASSLEAVILQCQKAENAATEEV